MAITIPGFPEDRGPVKVDPATGSTLTKEASYCRDLKGCGDLEYLFLSQSMSINDCDAELCQRRFIASISVNIILYGPETDSGDVAVLMDYIKGNLTGAHKVCPS